MKQLSKRLARGVLAGTLFMAYQSPGCSFSLDEAGVQEILELLNSGNGFHLNLNMNPGSGNSGSNGHDDDYDDDFDDEDFDEDDFGDI